MNLAQSAGQKNSQFAQISLSLSLNKTSKDYEVKKELIHVETYKELFPYARAMISSLTVNAGIPPVIIPNFDIESQCIYKFGKNC